MSPEHDLYYYSIWTCACAEWRMGEKCPGHCLGSLGCSYGLAMIVGLRALLLAIVKTINDRWTWCLAWRRWFWGHCVLNERRTGRHRWGMGSPLSRSITLLSADSIAWAMRNVFWKSKSDSANNLRWIQLSLIPQTKRSRSMSSRSLNSQN